MKSFLVLVPALMLLSACASKQYPQFDREQTLNRFQSRFNASHPDRPISNELVEMGVQYGTAQGWNMSSRAGVMRLEKELKTVAENSDARSRWLFRGTFHVAGTTNAFTRIVYGVATMSQPDAELSIVSDSKNAGIHFSGVSAGGRLSGTIDIAAGAVVCKARAEGSRVPRRISLDSQGKNTSELIRGSFVFLR